MNRLQRVFLTSVFSLAAFCAFAEDGELLSLKQIDALIEKNYYNEALKNLAQYMSENPDDFDRAQKRVSRIMQKRNEYNRNAGNLVELIKNEHGNRAEKLEDIQKLERAEEQPTDNVVEFTNLARRTVTLGEVLISYNRIMHEGIALVRAEKYPDAARKFEEGFDIKNDQSDIVFEVDENGEESDTGVLVVYEKDITEPVKKSVSVVKKIVSSELKDAENDCERAYKDYMKALEMKSPENCRKAFEKVRSAFSAFAGVRNKIMAESRILDKADRLATQRNPLLLGTSYITFYQKFILGDETNPDTGVIGAMDAYWNIRVETMKKGAERFVVQALAELMQKIPAENIYQSVAEIESSSKILSDGAYFASLALGVNSLYELPQNLDGTVVADDYPGYSRAMGFAVEYLKYLSLSYDSVKRIASEENSGIYLLDDGYFGEKETDEYIKRVRRYETIKNESAMYLRKVDDEYKRENDFYVQSAKRKAEMESLKLLTGGIVSDSSKRSTAGVEIDGNPLDLRDAIGYFTKIGQQNIQKADLHAREIWGNLAQWFYSDGKNSYEDFETKIAEAEALIQGTESADGILQKYPSRAKSLSLALISQIQGKKADLSQKHSLLDGGSAYSGIEADYDSGKSQLAKIILDFDSLRIKCNEIAVRAEPLIRQFELAFDEGQSQYAKALAAFKKNDFDAANAAVERASDKLAEAMDIEYSEKARKLREETLAELANNILAAENAQVMRDVFALKEQANEYYYANNFDSAENSLVQAQARLSKTNPDPDPEIEELLELIRNIKNFSYGEVLKTSDPHYPELSYSLDMAKLSFERGSELKKKGGQEEAKNLFNTAMSYVRNVQNVYPLNKEARFIALRIQQEIDPAGFPKQFESLYKTAKMNPVPRERLSELQLLLAINPKYPGLKSEIDELEESLRPKRVVKSDDRKLASSKLSEAKKLFRAAGNDEAALNRALAVVNEAIKLDGTSKEAKNLRLDIQLKIGAQMTAILSLADQKMLAEASRLLNLRREGEAKAVIDRLWEKPAAKRNKKVIEIRKRILKRLSEA